MKSQSRIGVTIDSRCESIDLFLTPTRSDASSDATLYISGITDVHPAWDTWEWQITDKYDIGTTFNEEPVWTTVYTGGVVRANSDDSVIRVKLTVGTCTYYSNVVGYDDPYVPSYKVYTAILTQVSTDAPIVTVLENTLSGAIVWTRTNPGIYLGTLAAAFPLGKTWAIAQYNGSGGDPKVGLKLFRLSNNTVQLISYDSSEIPYELQSEIEEYVEIRVYP